MSDSSKKPKVEGISFEVDEGVVPGPLLQMAKVFMVQAACAVRDLEGAVGAMREEMERGSPINEGMAHAVIAHNATEAFMSAIAWLDSMSVFLDMERKGVSIEQHTMRVKKTN